MYHTLYIFFNSDTKGPLPEIPAENDIDIYEPIIEENGTCEPIKKETMVYYPIADKGNVEETRRISYVNSDAGQCQQACSVYVDINIEQQQHLLEEMRQYSRAVYEECDKPIGTTKSKH